MENKKSKLALGILIGVLIGLVLGLGSFIIYDFSKVTDKIKLELNLVDFTVEPGVSCIPNRIAMQVCSDVMIEWRKLSYNKDNEIWMKSVKLPNWKTTVY